MLEKRKIRTKMIILVVVCIVLAIACAIVGMICLSSIKNYNDLKSQNAKLQQNYNELNSQLAEKETQIAELKQDIQELNQQSQPMTVEKNTESQKNVTDQEDDDVQGIISPSFGDSAFSDTELNVGETINDSEISNIDRYFTSSVIDRDGEIFNRINGKSYRDNDDIQLEDLRYLTIPYYNFENQVILGEMIVNAEIQDDVLNVFKELFNNQYQIKSMRLIDDYWEDGCSGNDADSNSIEDNNTSCFCYRAVTGGESISMHGYGRAIDINPQQNPYVEDGANSHRNADEYVDNRSLSEPHVIMASDEDICYSTFAKYGFSWGGNWENPIDYQHFEKR